MRKLVKTIKTLTWLDNFGSTSTIYVSRFGDTKNLEENNTTTGGDSNKLNEEDTDEINTNIHNKCQNRSEDKSQLEFFDQVTEGKELISTILVDQIVEWAMIVIVTVLIFSTS